MVEQKQGGEVKKIVVRPEFNVPVPQGYEGGPELKKYFASTIRDAKGDKQAYWWIKEDDKGNRYVEIRFVGDFYSADMEEIKRGAQACVQRDLEVQK